MLSKRSKSASSKTRVVVLATEDSFGETARSAFAAGQIEVDVATGTLSENEERIVGEEATVLVLDIEAGRPDEMAALGRVMGKLNNWPPVVAVVQSFDKDVARQLMQMRISDFLVKPVAPIELVRACARVIQAPAASEQTEAEIVTYLPAVGGAGVTTLAIQTALLLLNSGGGQKAARPSTCLVDLDFQHGACADYLDLEPRLDLKEIEPRPERLDRQLLEVMLSYHASGLAVIAAPNRPAEMRSFDPDMVTRLLDLVSSNFKYVVIDMPRTWFSWTDSVLLGSNKLFVVSEMTVPGLKHAKHLVAAIGERLGERPSPKVIVNRFEQSFFGPGLRKRDIELALGEHFACALPNDYRMVREAIDRGVPLDEVKSGNKITQQLKKLITPPPEKPAAAAPATPAKLSLSLAR